MKAILTTVLLRLGQWLGTKAIAWFSREGRKHPQTTTNQENCRHQWLATVDLDDELIPGADEYCPLCLATRPARR